MDYPLNLNFARAWGYTLRDTERRREVKEGKTLNYPQRLFSLLTDWTRREHIYISNWSLSSRSLPAVNGAIMHAWIRVANMEKRYMGYHRQWETDCTVLTPRVGLCRQRCCCMLYRERKNGANRLCFVQRYFATEPQTQGRRRLAGRDASELSHRQEREQTTQTHFWFAKKLNETVAQWAAPKQHFIGYLSKKKQHTDSHTQVIAQRSKNVEMAKMKNLLFARAVTVTGEIPF